MFTRMNPATELKHIDDEVPSRRIKFRQCRLQRDVMAALGVLKNVCFDLLHLQLAYQ